MKKVSEIAKELTVTRQSIYKRINSTLTDELTGHIFKDEKGSMLIDTEGVVILKESFTETKGVNGTVNDKEDYSTVDSTDYCENDSANSDLNKFLMKHIEDLTKQNESLINKLEIMQMLLRNEQEKGRLLLPEVTEKSNDGFLKRWFKK